MTLPSLLGPDVHSALTILIGRDGVLHFQLHAGTGLRPETLSTIILDVLERGVHSLRAAHGLPPLVAVREVVATAADEALQ